MKEDTLPEHKRQPLSERIYIYIYMKEDALTEHKRQPLSERIYIYIYIYMKEFTLPEHNESTW